MSKPRVAFWGTPDFAVPVLAALFEFADVPLVVTQPPKPVGKGQRVQKSPVYRWAEAHGLDVFTSTSFKDASARERLGALAVDLAVVAAYGKILPKWSLDWPARGMVNVHASLLPKYRGASPIQGALLGGESTTGITFMQMNEKMDEGDILRQHEIVIETDETAQSLTEKLAQLAAATLPEFLSGYLASQIKPRPQDSSQATYTKIIKKEDGLIDLYQPPADLERRIRAYYPWPSVWGLYKDKRIKFLPSGLVQLEGKRAVPLVDFLLGHSDFPLKSLV